MPDAGQQGDAGRQGGQGGAGQGGGSGGQGSPPWYQGIDGNLIGVAQNKGWKLDDPKIAFASATEAYREAQSKLGVPPDQLLRLLRPDSTPEDIKSFWGRLGKPADPKEYDFSDIKFSDGSELDAPFVDSMRVAYDAAHLPKETAAAVTKAFVKFMDDAEAQETAATTAKLQIERAELAKSWGGPPKSDRFKANLFIAQQGAKALGITSEAMAVIENAAGYKAVMEAMHKVGMLNKEDRFIAGGAGTTGAMTRDEASARKAELMKDTAWATRYLDGDVNARDEMDNLNRIIVGYFEAA